MLVPLSKKYMVVVGRRDCALMAEVPLKQQLDTIVRIDIEFPTVYVLIIRRVSFETTRSSRNH